MSGLRTPSRPRPGETFGARLVRPTELRARPGGRVVARLGTRTSFHSISVLAVVRQRRGWLGVLAPEAGNGRVGWIAAGDAQLLRETWAIEIDLSKRRALLRHRGHRYRSFPVAIGSAAYPTPTGRFAVTDRLHPGGAGSPYGCCVLALTARQPDVPQDWPGGDRIAIHGTNNPGSVGQAASHGCLRASAQAMRVLMARVPLGTPVTIRG